VAFNRRPLAKPYSGGTEALFAERVIALLLVGTKILTLSREETNSLHSSSLARYLHRCPTKRFNTEKQFDK
jgi:hypothetical protein